MSTLALFGVLAWETEPSREGLLEWWHDLSPDLRTKFSRPFAIAMRYAFLALKTTPLDSEEEEERTALRAQLRDFHAELNRSTYPHIDWGPRRPTSH